MDPFFSLSDATASAEFRRVLWTGEHTQLVVMTLPAGSEIGAETHEHNDQILSFVDGAAHVDVGDRTRAVAAGDVVVVPAGVHHNVRNTGEVPLVLATIYGPPEHPDGIVHATEQDAAAAEHHH